MDTSGSMRSTIRVLRHASNNLIDCKQRPHIPLQISYFGRRRATRATTFTFADASRRSGDVTAGRPADRSNGCSRRPLRFADDRQFMSARVVLASRPAVTRLAARPLARLSFEQSSRLPTRDAQRRRATGSRRDNQRAAGDEKQAASSRRQAASSERPQS